MYIVQVFMNIESSISKFLSTFLKKYKTANYVGNDANSKSY